MVFTQDNTYQKIAYLDLLKILNPGNPIDVLTKDNIINSRAKHSEIYIICDYLFYSSHCICKSTHGNFIYVLDELNNSISSVSPDILNRAAHHWFLNRTTPLKLKCMYCNIMNELTPSEQNMINTIRMLCTYDTDIQRSILSLLGITNKVYSRIMLQLLNRLGLKRIHALVLWCHSQSLTPF